MTCQIQNVANVALYNIVFAAPNNFWPLSIHLSSCSAIHLHNSWNRLDAFFNRLCECQFLEDLFPHYVFQKSQLHLIFIQSSINISSVLTCSVHGIESILLLNHTSVVLLFRFTYGEIIIRYHPVCLTKFHLLLNAFRRYFSLFLWQICHPLL